MNEPVAVVLRFDAAAFAVGFTTELLPSEAAVRRYLALMMELELPFAFEHGLIYPGDAVTGFSTRMVTAPCPPVLMTAGGFPLLPPA